MLNRLLLFMLFVGLAMGQRGAGCYDGFCLGDDWDRVASVLTMRYGDDSYELERTVVYNYYKINSDTVFDMYFTFNTRGGALFPDRLRQIDLYWHDSSFDSYMGLAKYLSDNNFNSPPDELKKDGYESIWLWGGYHHTLTYTKHNKELRYCINKYGRM
jgi:hypothetical protein